MTSVAPASYSNNPAEWCLCLEHHRGFHLRVCNSCRVPPGRMSAPTGTRRDREPVASMPMYSTLYFSVGCGCPLPARQVMPFHGDAPACETCRTGGAVTHRHCRRCGTDSSQSRPGASQMDGRRSRGEVSHVSRRPYAAAPRTGVPMPYRRQTRT